LVVFKDFAMGELALPVLCERIVEVLYIELYYISLMEIALDLPDN
jgi:hypothetical protein